MGSKWRMAKMHQEAVTIWNKHSVKYLQTSNLIIVMQDECY